MMKDDKSQRDQNYIDVKLDQFRSSTDSVSFCETLGIISILLLESEQRQLFHQHDGVTCLSTSTDLTFSLLDSLIIMGTKYMGCH